MQHSKKSFSWFLFEPFKISLKYFFIKLFELLFYGFYPLLEVLSFSYLVNEAIKIKDSSITLSTVLAIGIFVLLMFCKYLFSHTVKVLSLPETKKIMLHLREMFITKITRLEYYYIEDSEFYDRIQVLKTELLDTFLVKHSSILQGIKIILEFISILIIIFSVMGIKGFVILIAVFCVALVSVYNGKKNYEQKQETAFLERKADYYSDVLTEREFLAERKVFNYANYLNNKFEYYNKATINIVSKTKLKNMLRRESTSLFVLAIFVYFIINLSQSVLKGAISIGVLIATVKQFQNFTEIIRWSLYSVLEMKQEVQNYLCDLNEFYTYNEVLTSLSINTPLETDTTNVIQIRNLTFAYPKTEKLIANGFNFSFEKNKMYAIIGENGCGKSTLIKLLLGLYKNYEGEILIHGNSIKQMSQEDISKTFSVVFQDYGHYYLTLNENVLIGNLTATDDTVSGAMKLFSLDEVAEYLDKNAILNKGDDSNADLSGGQWQNVALARSFVSDNEILIFDEPTASLSPTQETKIYTFLKDITKNKTAIFISHRLGIAPLVDEILVMQDGKVIEHGSHNELIRDVSSVYATMYNSQKELYK